MNKPINQSGWKPGTPVASDGSAHPTVTGNKALMLEEPLIFESGGADICGVDLPETPTDLPSRLALFVGLSALLCQSALETHTHLLRYHILNFRRQGLHVDSEGNVVLIRQRAKHRRWIGWQSA